jgi:hypothetical protein
LRLDIKNKLSGDVAIFNLTKKALAAAPVDVAAYAAEASKLDDFLDPVREDVAHPTVAAVSLTRPKYSAGRIVPRDGAGPKEGAATPHGGINSTIDDKGHLVPEKGVSDANSVNVNSADNVIPENWVINQRFKTAFEEGVKEFARDNPTLHVMTFHMPIYASKKGALAGWRARPKQVIHFMAINGTIISAFTFKNSKRIIQARAT